MGKREGKRKKERLQQKALDLLSTKVRPHPNRKSRQSSPALRKNVNRRGTDSVGWVT